MSHPVVFTVMLTFNQREQTVEALHSLLASDYPELRTVIVDNGSADDTVECLSATFPQVNVIANSQNLGFAEGCNVGTREALAQGADYVFLLNNDVDLAKDAVRILVEAAEADPLVGVVGPKVYRWGTSSILQSVGGRINRTEVRSELIGDGEQDVGQYDVLREVPFVSGCALLAKRVVLERVGLLDPLYFWYYEEVDWCWRAWQAGFRVLCVPQAQVWHKGGMSSGGNSYLVSYLTTRNRLVFGSRHANWRGKAYLTIFSLVTLLKAAWHLRRGGRRGWSRAVTLGILDFCLGRLGRGSYLAGR